MSSTTDPDEGAFSRMLAEALDALSTSARELTLIRKRLDRLESSIARKPGEPR